MSNFHNILTAEMSEKDVTQKRLCDELHVTQATISRYMAGEREPNLDIVIKIAKILQVTSDYLLGLEDEAGIKKNIDEQTIEKKPLSEKEQYVVKLYRQLIPVGQKLAISYLENMQEVNSIPKSNRNFD